MENIPKLNERPKETIDWSKVRTQLIIGAAVVGMFYCTCRFLGNEASKWNEKHGFQSPVILRSPIYDKQTKQPEKVSEVIVKPVEAKAPFCQDIIGCIRDIGESQNVSNKDIMTMIRIAKAESNYNSKAKNPKGTASGIFQITAATWFSNDCTGDKFNYQDNITCAYKIYSKRHFQPWEVCSNGMVDCN